MGRLPAPLPFGRFADVSPRETKNKETQLFLDARARYAVLKGRAETSVRTRGCGTRDKRELESSTGPHDARSAFLEEECGNRVPQNRTVNVRDHGFRWCRRAFNRGRKWFVKPNNQ